MRNTKLTILMIQSFEDDATRALLELTAKSVMSPLDSYRCILVTDTLKNNSKKLKDMRRVKTHFMPTATGQAIGRLH